MVFPKCLIYILNVTLLSCIALNTLNAQQPLKNEITINFDNISLEDALWKLGEVSKYAVTYNNTDIPNSKISLDFKNTPLSKILKELLSSTDLLYDLEDDQIVIHKNPYHDVNFNGYIEDSETGERLIGANIYGTESLKGSTSNIFGFFSLTVSSRNKSLTVSYLGYESEQILIKDKEKNPVIISLVPQATLPEIIVTDRIYSKTKIPFQTENQILSKTAIKQYPSLGGEVDVLRIIQQLPGAQTGTDGIGGLNIRGGNSDQNLVLLDGAAIYNPYHTLGLFSIFDINSIQKVNYLRGQFPARYGGRLSSVVDIRTKDGNNKKQIFQFSTGLLSTRSSLEGPILKDKMSYFLSYRRSHLDPFLKKYSKNKRIEDNGSGFYNYAFGEFTGKLSYSFSKNDRIYFSIYKGFDKYENEHISNLSEDQFYTARISQLQNLDWGNSVAALRWNHIYGSKVFSNLSLTYSRFNFNSDNLEEEVYDIQFNNESIKDTFSYQSLYRSLIEKVHLKYDVDIIPNASHYIRLGTAIARHNFVPGIINSEASFFDIENIRDSITQNPLSSLEWNFYLEDQWTILPSLSMNLGVYNTLFSVRNKVYFLPNPRININYTVNKKLSFHASTSHTSQNLHVLTRSGAGFPTDLWVPSTSKVGPKTSLLLDIGLHYKISNRWNIAIDGYYKKMYNLIDYKENVNFGIDNDQTTLDASNWEDNVTFGDGLSKGVEVILKKETGSTNLWLSYTLSKTTRQFEAINQGIAYPFRFDHRHNINLNANYKWTKSINISSSFSYNTGSKTNIPRSKWQYIRNDGTLDYFYYDLGTQNSFQLPDFHRLNIELQYHKTPSWGKWSLHTGIYNVYNRKNLYLISTDFNPTTQNVQYTGTSLIPFLPYFSISIEI